MAQYYGFRGPGNIFLNKIVLHKWQADQCVPIYGSQYEVAPLFDEEAIKKTILLTIQMLSEKEVDIKELEDKVFSEIIVNNQDRFQGFGFAFNV